MLRIILIDIALFLLPFLLYAAYLYWRRGVAPKNAMSGAPIVWLVLAGIVCVFVGLLTLVSFSGGGRDADYTPAVLKDGVIKPGRLD